MPLTVNGRKYLTIRDIANRLGKPEWYHRIRRIIIKSFERDVFGESIIDLGTGSKNYGLGIAEDSYMEVLRKWGRP